MKIWRKFVEDEQGISVMHDAVLFCLMVSIAGAILMPALVSDVAKESYMEKENEEKVEEVLHQLMVCKLDEFSHLNAEPVLKNLKINTNQGLLKPVIDNLLKREQLHRTYADLCTECVACQFKVLGHRLNILTQNFTEMMRVELKKFLERQLGRQYKYNFTVVWNPIVGFDFGGDLSVGSAIPKTNVYVAVAYATMPPSLFTTGIGFPLQTIKNYVYNDEIKNEFTDAKEGLISKDEFKDLLTSFLTDLINRVIWEGFDGKENSLVDIVIDYIFQGIKESIQDAFGEALSMVSGIISSVGDDFPSLSDELIRNNLQEFLPTITESDTFSKSIDEVKNYIKEEVRAFIKNTIEEKIQAMVENVVNSIDGITNIGTEILNWLFQQINFCRAKMTLAIWEV